MQQLTKGFYSPRKPLQMKNLIIICQKLGGHNQSSLGVTLGRLRHQTQSDSMRQDSESNPSKQNLRHSVVRPQWSSGIVVEKPRIENVLKNARLWQKHPKPEAKSGYQKRSVRMKHQRAKLDQLFRTTQLKISASRINTEGSIDKAVQRLKEEIMGKRKYKFSINQSTCQ